MQHRAIPYDMSHFPISPLDLEFLLTGLDGLCSGSPTDDDLSETDYDEDTQLTSNAEVAINGQTTG